MKECANRVLRQYVIYLLSYLDGNNFKDGVDESDDENNDEPSTDNKDFEDNDDELLPRYKDFVKKIIDFKEINGNTSNEVPKDQG